MKPEKKLKRLQELARQLRERQGSTMWYAEARREELREEMKQEGAVLEYRYKDRVTSHDKWENLGMTLYLFPDNDFAKFDFRVRVPTPPVYVPYTDPAQVRRDEWVRYPITSSVVCRITGVGIHGIVLGDSDYSWDEAMSRLVYEDGTPFGQLEGE